LTWIATKSNSTFLLIPPYSLSKNDWNSCNEFDARFDLFKIKSSYYRNSKLRISFVPTKWFLVGKMDIHFLGSCSLVFKTSF
jgi:hypothetical protein